MYKLIVAELAHQDLDNIVSYIAIQLANLTAAVAKCYGYLKSNPMMYASVKISGWKKKVTARR
jgi:toxin ParE1/3/4